MAFSDLWFVAFLALSLTSCHSAAKQPNILLILADDYGWNDVGYHGSEIRTPTLDRLAEEGVKLENYYVQPICTPSRSQLMTGRYQIHTGLQHFVIQWGCPYGLPLSDKTMADQLKQVGYATHLVGKWHLGSHTWEYTPLYRGFDTHYGYYQGMEDYYNHTSCQSPNVCGLDFWDQKEPIFNLTGSYSANLFADRAERIVKQHAQISPDKPMFMYLALQNVHAPLEVPEKYKDQYNFIQNEDRRAYAGMVSIMDEAIGQVVDAYKDAGLWDNTILFFSADNGGEPRSAGNNWPLMGGKTTLWEGGVRGVGFVSGPALGRRGATSREMMHISDWFPTIVHLAGGTTDGLKLDSYDVWPSIRDGRESPRTELLHNIDPLYALKGQRLYNDTFDNRVHAAIRWKNWKLLTGDPGTRTRWTPQMVELPVDMTDGDEGKNIWLFDLDRDPLEVIDVSSANPDLVRMLLDKLAAYNATSVPVQFPPYDPNSAPDKHNGIWMPWL